MILNNVDDVKAPSYSQKHIGYYRPSSDEEQNEDKRPKQYDVSRLIAALSSRHNNQSSMKEEKRST
jgi:hypothetical protein